MQSLASLASAVPLRSTTDATNKVVQVEAAKYAAKNNINNYSDAVKITNKMKSAIIESEAQGQQGSLFDSDSEFQNKVSTLAEQVKIENSIEQAAIDERNSLIQGVKLKEQSGEIVNKTERQILADQIGQNTNDIKLKFKLVFENNSEAMKLVQDAAERVKNGELTTKDAVTELSDGINAIARRPHADLLSRDVSGGVAGNEGLGTGTGDIQNSPPGIESTNSRPGERKGDGIVADEGTTKPQQIAAAKAESDRLSGSGDMFQETSKAGKSKPVLGKPAGVKTTGRKPTEPAIWSTEAKDAAFKRIADKTSRLNTGFDPSLLYDYSIVGAHYIEKGVREFGAWSKQMINDFGEDIKPHLDDLWKRAQELRGNKALKFNNELINAHHGQTDHILSAKTPDGKIAGTLEYSVFEDTPHVSMITVPENMRRQGYGKALMHELQNMHPNTEINMGSVATKEGQALINSLKVKEVPTEFSDSFKKLDELKQEESKLQSIADKYYKSENNTPKEKEIFNQQMDRLNKVNDEIYSLEEETKFENPTKKIIQTNSKEEAQFGINRTKDGKYRVFDANKKTVKTFEREFQAEKFVYSKHGRTKYNPDTDIEIRVENNDSLSAIDKMIDLKRGIISNLTSPLLKGNIELFWGEHDIPLIDKKYINGYGAAHIIDGHGYEALRNIADILNKGKRADNLVKQGRVGILYDGKLISIDSIFNGKEKQWIVTSYEINRIKSESGSTLNAGKTMRVSSNKGDGTTTPSRVEPGDSSNNNYTTSSEKVNNTKKSKNTFISEKVKDDKWKSFLDKGTNLKSGFDPTMLSDAAIIGAYHLETGIREVAAWSKKMIEDFKALDIDIRPYLDDLWNKAHEKLGIDPPAVSKDIIKQINDPDMLDNGAVPPRVPSEPNKSPDINPDNGLPKYVENLNLERMNTPDDILNFVYDMTAEPTNANIAKQRVPVVLILRI